MLIMHFHKNFKNIIHMIEKGVERYFCESFRCSKSIFMQRQRIIDLVLDAIINQLCNLNKVYYIRISLMNDIKYNIVIWINMIFKRKDQGSYIEIQEQKSNSRWGFIYTLLLVGGAG